MRLTVLLLIASFYAIAINAETTTVTFDALEVADGDRHNVASYTEAGLTFSGPEMGSGSGIFYDGQSGQAYQGSAAIYVQPSAILTIEAQPGKPMMDLVSVDFADLCGGGIPNSQCTDPGHDIYFHLTTYARDGSEFSQIATQDFLVSPGAVGTFRTWNFPSLFVGFGVDKIEVSAQSGIPAYLQIDNFVFEESTDTDHDGIPDLVDNCTLVSNMAQRDTDNDGIGNHCDADLNNDCIVNFIDLGLAKSVFFTDDPNADFSGDGLVNFIDLGIMKSGFFLPPGPSADGSCAMQCTHDVDCNGAICSYCLDGHCEDHLFGTGCGLCRMCDGLGTCDVVPAGQDPSAECGGYFCNGAGACETLCVDNSQCKPMYYCDTGSNTCVVQPPPD